MGIESIQTQPYKWNFNFGAGSSTASSTAIGNNSHETFKEYQERIERERAERYKKQEEIEAQKKQIDEQLNLLKTQEAEQINAEMIKKAKKGKVQEDGTIKTVETMADYKKLPWYKKVGRALSNMGTGAWGLATGFIGYETDPKTGEEKWNPLKLAKNVGIAGACIGLCCIPYVGPVISTALIASGVAIGAWQTGKGIYKICKTNKPEEIDQGFQDIGAGLTAGTASCVGLKGLGKGLQASSSSASATAAASGAASGVRSTAAAGLTRSMGRNAISQFFKDCTINAGRATVQGMRNSRTALRNNINGMTGWKSTWGIRHTLGFGKSWGQNIGAMVPKFGKTKFENGKNSINQAFDEELARIEARKAAIQEEILYKPNNSVALDNEFALLKRQQAFLKAQKAQINSAVTRSQYQTLATESKAHQEAKYLADAVTKLKDNGFVRLKINGRTYKIQNNGKNLEILKNIAKSAENAAKKGEEIAQLRASTMRFMAFKKGAKAEVNAYTGKDRSFRLARIYDTTPKVTWKTPIKLALELGALPFKPWNYIEKSAISTGYKVEQAIFTPHYEEEFVGSIMGMFGNKPWGNKICMDDLPTLNEAGEIVRDASGNVVKQSTVITKDILEQLEATQKQFEDAISSLEVQKRNLDNIG